MFNKFLLELMDRFVNRNQLNSTDYVTMSLAMDIVRSKIYKDWKRLD